MYVGCVYHLQVCGVVKILVTPIESCFFSYAVCYFYLFLQKKYSLRFDMNI